MAGDFDIGPADYEADRMSENGKGDTPRPIVVDSETYKKNWEHTFPKQQTLPDENGKAKPIHFIDRTEDVFFVPITLRHSLETLGDPDE